MRPIWPMIAIACAGGYTHAEILSSIGGGIGARLAVTPLGFPPQDNSALDHRVPFVPDSVSFSFNGSDLSLSEEWSMAVDYGTARGSAHATSSAMITQDTLNLSNLGGASAVADESTWVSSENARVTYSAGAGTWVVLSPFVEFEITMTVNLGVRSSNSFGFTMTSAFVSGLNGQDDEVSLTLDSRHDNDSTSSTLTFTGYSDEYTELRIETNTEILVWGTEIGGVPTSVDDAGSSVSIRIIPSPGTLGCLAVAPIIWTRRRR